MEQLLDALPDQMVLNRKNLKSSLYQPDRVSLNSQDDITNENESVNPFYYNSYRIRLQRPCLNVKSLQLLRASVPTPIASFPDGECMFFYYRYPVKATGTIQTLTNTTLFTFDISGIVYNFPGGVANGWKLDFLGNIIQIATNTVIYTYNLNTAVSTGQADCYLPDTSPANFKVVYNIASYTPDLSVSDINNIYWIRLLPSYYQQTYDYNIQIVQGDPTIDVPPNQMGTNKQFADYPDLVVELNKACQKDPSDGVTWVGGCRHIPGDLSFYLDESLKKIYFQGNNGYYYQAASYNDPTVNSGGLASYVKLLTSLPQIVINGIKKTYDETNGQPIAPYRPMNLRLGYTWNNVIQTGIYQPKYQITLQYTNNYANSYGDLVNSSDLYVYVSFIGGSTLDSAGNGGLLAVVPLNTSQNCVAFYNNLMYQPALKIPEQISEIEVQFKDDAGNPFLLPNSAITNLEIGFQYF